MSTTTTEAISILTNYTQAEEDTLAATLTGQSAGARVIYNTTLDVARIWNGTAFENTPEPIANPYKKVIRQLSDFPTPSGGVITLEDYNTYQISGTVDIGTNRIVCGIKNSFSGIDRMNDVLVYTGTGNMFTMDSSSVAKLSLIFQTMTLQCSSGTLFNVTGGSGNQLTIISTTMSGVSTAGTIDGVAMTMRTSSLTGCVVGGFTFSGTNLSLVVQDSTISNNAGTSFNFSSTTFTSIIRISRNFIQTNASQTFVNGTSVSVTYGGQVSINSFTGAGTFFTGITAQTAGWLFSDNTGVTNTVNGNSQLVELTAAGKYPALDGSLITNLPASPAAWGSITGTLSDQTDLNTALGLKAPLLSPSFTTPTLGVATATSINGLTITSSTGTLTITNGKTLSISNTLTFTGTDSSSVAFGSGGTVLYNGGALGTPSSGTLTNCTFPILNQNTTGSAASLSVSGQSGLITLVGITSTNRVKTVRDAADTILELGGSYTPTGTWTSMTLVTPALGTPSSGTLTNCTGYTDANLSTSDITTNNFSITKHGFVPKGTNVGNFLKDDGTWAAPSGSGDMILASAQTNTGIKTFLDTTMKLRNVANTFDGYFVNTNTANRVYTLQDANGTIAFTSDISSGNSATATALQTARTIGGVSFDGTANIVPQTIESVNEASDTTCFPLFITASGTQSLQPKNNTSFTFNSSTGALGATSFVGSGTSLTGIPYSLTGTANQVILSAATGNITFSLPQSISTSSNPQFATIELGAASDTTIARVSAGLISVEGNTLLSNTTTSGVGTSPTASQTDTITHSLGRVPTIIRIYGYGTFTSNAAATATTSSIGIYCSSGNRCVYQRYGAAITTTQAGLSSTTFAILLATGGGNYISGVIQNVTSTQFDIVWTETGTATAQVYMWEAQ